MEMQEGRMSIKVHSDDNVVTLLNDDLGEGYLADGTPIGKGIAMGHKVALADIGVGKSVIKYGVIIGVATQPILKGEHVHVHNCA